MLRIADCFQDSHIHVILFDAAADAVTDDKHRNNQKHHDKDKQKTGKNMIQNQHKSHNCFFTVRKPCFRRQIRPGIHYFLKFPVR